MVVKKAKAQVYRCEGEDTFCDMEAAHWIAVTPDGMVTTWRSWARAMQRAVMGW